MMILLTGKNRNNLQSKGITLLEVLIAISILAICVVAIFQAFISSFDAQIRAENYARTFMTISDSVEYADEFTVPASQQEWDGNNGRILWQFTQNDIKDYPQLKEVALDANWEQGKRNGKFSLTTYFWNPQKQ